MSMVDRLSSFFGGSRKSANITANTSEQENKLPGEQTGPTSEQGYRPTPENRLDYLYQRMWVDPERRQSVMDVRAIDRRDGRVKKVHTKISRTVVKGGLMLETSSENKQLIKAWESFLLRTNLKSHEKLESHARGFAIEGNLAMQWILNNEGTLVDCARMASDSIMPRVAPSGRFIDPAAAYEQYDISSGELLHSFPLWQLTIGRLSPDNYDDWGSMGRPYLDSAREIWQKLNMTEEDLVIRRHDRAAQRLSHVLEGANKDELEEYQQKIESNPEKITTDFYSNKKGSVTAVAGDANLDQIADVNLLIDAFFACSPAPKGLFGYADGLSRDVLEDLNKDYYEEMDALQDIGAGVYEQGFRLDLLLQGINPNRVKFKVKFAERRTDTPNQRADLALKHQALGLPREHVWRAAGANPALVLEQIAAERKSNSPYPDDEQPTSTPRVSVTPGNERKGESGTSITTSNGG